MTLRPNVIVGAGATGCTLALLSATLGVPTTVIQRRAESQLHPAANSSQPRRNRRIDR
ncbi:FAD-dependent monooxygenase [Nocardia abscessus]|uniref:FAD-dependent monooxygenase n=1 Tax=Nocardia abscessus TaxID=120957 RepID=UPI001894717A|nr:FAD-dependent monooxygenase [Nocardia abscessus]MBF6341097.1 FAD-dependent monooxygenase [Nocardia abscessus]